MRTWNENMYNNNSVDQGEGSEQGKGVLVPAVPWWKHILRWPQTMQTHFTFIAKFYFVPKGFLFTNIQHMKTINIEYGNVRKHVEYKGTIQRKQFVQQKMTFTDP